jgi:hypothetical protein
VVPFPLYWTKGKKNVSSLAFCELVPTILHAVIADKVVWLSEVEVVSHLYPIRPTFTDDCRDTSGVIRR